MTYKINLGLQILPITESTRCYQIIDQCIHIIQTSGIQHQVTAFETILEGTYVEVMELVSKIHDFSLTQTEELVINIRMHSKANSDVHAIDKTKKFS
uniref:thiamine-binding protein n=1 Tax=Roseivirga sp. TaxID=1964215 RepID=UPI004047BA1C